MSRTPYALVAVLALSAAACGGKDLPSNWVTVPTRSSHDAFFPISTGAHATADCNTCHGAYNTFKQFDCSTSACHVGISSTHPAVTGFATDGPTCLGCHPQGTMAAPANHDTAFFPRGSGTAHATVACTQCHKNLNTPNDPTAFGCYDCHSTLVTWPHPTSVTIGSGLNQVNVSILTITTGSPGATTRTSIDITNNPASCLRCHADSQVNTVASHPGGSGSLGQNDSHGGAGCLTCHQAMRTDKTFGADFGANPSPPGSGTGCGTCHATTPN